MKFAELMERYAALKLRIAVYELLLTGDEQRTPQQAVSYRYGEGGTRELSDVLSEIEKRCMAPIRDEIARIENILVPESGSGERNEPRKTRQKRSTAKRPKAKKASVRGAGAAKGTGSRPPRKGRGAGPDGPAGPA